MSTTFTREVSVCSWDWHRPHRSTPRMVGEQELINRSCPRMAVRKPSIHFPQLFLPEITSFDWLVIGGEGKP